MMLKMRFDIQRFGGRGQGSGTTATGNSIAVKEQGRNVRISYYQLNNGDKFDVTEKSGETITMTIKNYSTDNGYYVEGRANDGGRISYLVSDEMYKKAGKTSRLFMIPLSKTKNWKKEKIING